MPAAMAALDRGGRLAIAGIHLSDIPALEYSKYLFEERELVRVTANTRGDGEDSWLSPPRYRSALRRENTPSRRPTSRSRTLPATPSTVPP